MARKSVQDKRRKQIFAALDRCLGKKPFNQTSIKDIAAEASVNHGVLHYYFESKEDLLLKYIDHTIDQYKTRFYRWMEKQELEKLGSEEIVERVLTFIYEKITLNEPLSRTFIELWEIGIYNKKVRTRLQKMYGEWGDITAGFVEKFIEDEKTARNIVMALIAFFEGMALFSIILGSREIDIKSILTGFKSQMPGMLSSLTR